jgi:hypothetical protein
MRSTRKDGGDGCWSVNGARSLIEPSARATPIEPWIVFIVEAKPANIQELTALCPSAST